MRNPHTTAIDILDNLTFECGVAPVAGGVFGEKGCYDVIQSPMCVLDGSSECLVVSVDDDLILRVHVTDLENCREDMLTDTQEVEVTDPVAVEEYVDTYVKDTLRNGLLALQLRGYVKA